MSSSKSRGTPARRRSSRGFTLVEIIVSFAILAITLVGLMQAFSAGLRSTAAAEREIALIQAARALLERVGADIPLVEGEQSGSDDSGLSWLVQIVPSSIVDPGSLAGTTFAPLEIRVVVGDADGRSMTLNTLRLASINPP